jgi:hypothetical protein
MYSFIISPTLLLLYCMHVQWLPLILQGMNTGHPLKRSGEGTGVSSLHGVHGNTHSYVWAATCSTCREKLQNCPVCRYPFSNTGAYLLRMCLEKWGFPESIPTEGVQRHLFCSESSHIKISVFTSNLKACFQLSPLKNAPGWAADHYQVSHWEYA